MTNYVFHPPPIGSPLESSDWRRWFSLDLYNAINAAIAAGGGSGGTVTHTTGPLTADQLIIGNGGADVKALGASGTTSTVLHGNTSGPPSYSAVSLTVDVSGILPVANGGTGTATPSLIAGTNVTITGTWPNQTINAASAGGTVTSVNVSGGTTGLTTSGGPVTGSGTITLGGTLAVANGGTGTASPSLVAGTNINITGTWPNQTVTSTATSSYNIQRGANWDNGTLAVDATQAKVVYTQVAVGGTITSWTILGDGNTGSCVVDVWKAPFSVSSLPTVANTITASAKPTISANKNATSSTLTGWTTSITAGDVLAFHIDSTSTFTSLTILLNITVP